MRRRHIAGTLALFVSGCGGSEEGGLATLRASQPEFSNDFAAFAAGSAGFSTTMVAVGSDGQSGSTGRIPVTVQPTDDGSGDMVILVEGEAPIRLARTPEGQYALTTPDGSLFVDAALSRHAGSLVLVQQVGNEVLAGLAVLGRETTNTAGQRGQAIFLGPSSYIAVDDGGQILGGSGGFLMVADFDSAAVDGRLALNNPVNPSNQFFFDFRNAPISGNGFSSSNLTQTGLNGTVTASALDARFYGPEAAQVGGTYEVDIAGGGGTAAFRGVLIGDRQDFDVDALVAAAQAAQATPSSPPPSIAVGNERIVLGSGSVVGGSGSVYPGGASSYYNSNTGTSFGADGGGCYYVGDWSNC
jgi:hypothetical protein